MLLINILFDDKETLWWYKDQNQDKNLKILPDH